MAVKKDNVLMDEVKEAMLRTAKRMLEANGSPSTELQVQIINSANEMVKTVMEYEKL